MMHANVPAAGMVERDLDLAGIPGVLWMPGNASAEDPAPLILLGQPGGFSLNQMRPRLASRAAGAARHGFATLALEQPGAGERAPIPGAIDVRVELGELLSAGRSPDADLVDRLILPLVERAVPEWRAALDVVLERPEVDGPVGFSGGVIAVGVALAAADPRIRAAGLFAGSYVPASTMDAARGLDIPVHMLLQWDDEGNDRQMALDLFDAFATRDKTLYASMGGHRGVPAHAGDDALRFFDRHLR